MRRRGAFRVITPVSLVTEAAGFLAAAVLCLGFPDKAGALALTLLRAMLLVSGLLSLLSFIGQPEKRQAGMLAKGLALLAGWALLRFWPAALSIGMGMLFGLWILINGLCKLIYAGQLFHDHARGGWLTLFSGLFHLAFSVGLLFSPAKNSGLILTLVGLYCLFNAFNLLADAVRALFHGDKDGTRLKSRVKIAPPVLLTSLLPMWLLGEINEALESPAQAVRWQQPKDGRIPAGEECLEIFLHLSRETANGFGHVDIAFEGMVYSYGNYDADSNRLFGCLSDGVMAVSPREPCIDYSLHHENKRLIGFTLALTHEQRDRVAQALEQVISECVCWQPPASFKNGQTYAVDAQRAVGTVYYKMQKPPFKTYNFMKTNCVAMAAILSSASGLDLMSMNGIVTPGSYFAFLDKQYRMENSIVVKRTVYA